MNDESTPATLPTSPCDPSTKMREVRVIVCGSRTWNDPEPIRSFLAGIHAECLDGSVVVAHGAAQGADLLGSEVARYLGLAVEVYPADWEKRGRSAGPIRNQQMFDDFQPHVVVAFSEHPITTGTKHMLSIAQKAGVPTYVIGHGYE